jgi:truncated hemoglobin YjbI
LTGQSEDESNEDLAKILRAFHAQLGTSDYMFDVIVGHFGKALLDLGFLEDIINEVVIVCLESLRPIAVFSSRGIRKDAEAIYRDGQSLWDRLGGDLNIDQLVDFAMDKLTESNIIKLFYHIPKSRMRNFKRRITRFLITGFGAPVSARSSAVTTIHSAESRAVIRDASKFTSTGGYDTSVYNSNISAEIESNHGGGSSPVGSFTRISSNTAVGGFVPWSSVYLRRSHGKFNITDEHFDEFVRCFAAAGRDCGCSDLEVDDIVTVMNSFREDVVIGWTIRSYNAQERSRNKSDTIYQKLGGTTTDPGLERFASRFYELVERDPRINEFFMGSSGMAIRKVQSDYIISLLGGPIARARPLEEVHRLYNITQHHFDCLLRNLTNAARDSGADSQLIDEISVTIEPLREVITSGTSSDNFRHLVNLEE